MHHTHHGEAKGVYTVHSSFRPATGLLTQLTKAARATRIRAHGIRAPHGVEIPLHTSAFATIERYPESQHIKGNGNDDTQREICNH